MKDFRGEFADGTPEHVKDRIISGRPGDGPVFMCGSGVEVVPVCRCGVESSYLCDFPVGNGKTCDMNLCDDCARVVGPDKHLCDIHWHMFAKKADPPYVAPKGPRLVK